MKKIVYIIIGVLLTACYEDIGNYSYEDLNIVTAISNIEDEYSVYQEGDPLVIQPVISHLNNDIAEYEYTWELEALSDDIPVQDTIISRSKDLSFVPGIRVLPTNYQCIYTIRNLETGVETKHRFKVKVDSATAFGDFVLSNDNGSAYVSLAKSDGRVFENFFRELTGKPIVGEGVALVLNKYTGNIDNVLYPFNKMTLLLKNETDRGHVIDFIDYTYLHDANYYFYGQPQSNLKSFLVDSEQHNFLVFENGNCCYEYVYNYNPDQPYVDYEDPTYTDVDFASAALGILHQNNGNFYIGGWSGMKEMRGTTLDGTSGHINIPGEILYCFKDNSKLSSYFHNYKILIKQADGAIKEYKIKHSWSGDDITTLNPDEWIGQDLIEDNTLFAKAYTEKYFYFSSGNKIYRYNYEVGVNAPQLFYTLPEGSVVTYLKMDKDIEQVGWSKVYKDINLMVGFHNPAKSGLNGSFYRIDQYEKKAVIKYDEKFYEIKDVLVKK